MSESAYADSRTGKRGTSCLTLSTGADRRLALFADRDMLIDRRAYNEGAFIAEFVVRASAEGDGERRIGAVVEHHAGF